MADTSTSPNMSLIIPTVGVDPGPDWASNLNASLSILDQHTHAPGSGIAITQDAISLSASAAPYDSLTFSGTNAFALRSVRFTAQPSALALATDVGCIYESGVDLYYNDGAGNQIRLTQGGSIVGTSGSITGLPSGTASASYAAGTFVWQSATNTAANMDAGSYILRNSTASSKGLTLSPPNAMAADYALVLPALPGSTLIMRLDTSGNMSATLGVDNSTLDISGNSLEVKAGGITTTQIAAGTIVNSNIADATITGAKLVDATVTTDKIEDAPEFNGNSMGLSNTGNQLFGQTNTYQLGSGGTYNCLALGNFGNGSGFRIISGKVRGSDGATLVGQGFSSSRSSTGQYTITPTQSSTGSIAITGTATCLDVGGTNPAKTAHMGTGSTSAMTIAIRFSAGALTDSDFFFFLMVSA